MDDEKRKAPGLFNRIFAKRTSQEPQGDIGERSRVGSVYRSLKKKLRKHKVKKGKDDVEEERKDVIKEADIEATVEEEQRYEALDNNGNSRIVEAIQPELSPTPTSKDPNNSVGREHFNLAKYGWFWGPISKQETGERLQTEPDGAFLVRDSSSARHIFTLSFRSYGRTFHAHIEYNRGYYSVGKEMARSSVAELIEAAVDASKDQVFVYSQSMDPDEPTYPVRLTKPVSRLTKVRSLKYLCRFVIRQYVTVDNIRKLPVPTKVIDYLEAGQY